MLGLLSKTEFKIGLIFLIVLNIALYAFIELNHSKVPFNKFNYYYNAHRYQEDPRVEGKNFSIIRSLAVYDSQWYLKQVTVSKDARRKGVGKSLIEHFLQYAKEQGVEKVFGDVHDDNEASLAMVRRAGGIESGEVRDVGEGDRRIIFRWTLNY